MLIYRQLSDAYIGVRDYVQTEHPDHSVRVRNILASIPAHLDHLSKLAESEPAERLERLRAAADRMSGWIKDTEKLVTLGRGEEAKLRLRIASGAKPLEEVRQRVDDFIQAEEILDLRHVEELRRSRARHLWSLAVGGVVTLVMAVGVVYVFSTGIARRIGVLSENACA